MLSLFSAKILKSLQLAPQKRKKAARFLLLPVRGGGSAAGSREASLFVPVFGDLLEFNSLRIKGVIAKNMYSRMPE